MFRDTASVGPEHTDRHALVEDDADLVLPCQRHYLGQRADVPLVQIQTLDYDEMTSWCARRLGVLRRDFTYDKSIQNLIRVS